MAIFGCGTTKSSDEARDELSLLGTVSADVSESEHDEDSVSEQDESGNAWALSQPFGREFEASNDAGRELSSRYQRRQDMFSQRRPSSRFSLQRVKTKGMVSEWQSKGWPWPWKEGPW